MKQFWYEQGRPSYFWLIYLPFKSYFNIYLFKALSVLLILAVTFVQFALLARFSPLSRDQALFVSAVALAWPFYHWMAWNMFPDQVPPLMFYGGWYLFLRGKEQGKLIVGKVIPLLMLFYSFFYQGFFVYHYALLGVFFLYTLNYPEKLIWQDIKSRFPTFIKVQWLWTFSPLIYFFAKKILFPIYGAYAGYYTIDLFSLKTLAFIAGGLLNTLFGPLVGIFFYYPLLPVLILVITGGWFWIKKRGPNPADEEEPGYAKGLMAVGFLLIFSIVFAHAANEKMAVLLTYQGRHSRFAGLGFGLLILGCLQFLRERFHRFGRTAMRFSMFLVLACLIYVDVNIYLTYQARWAKTLAVVYHLKQQSPFENVNIYFMRNQLPMGLGIDYHYADVSLVLNKAWGGEKYLGIPPYLQKNRMDREMISIVIRSLKSGSDPFKAAQDYLKIKHLDYEVAAKRVQDWEHEGLRTGVEHFQPGRCMGEIIVTLKKPMYDFVLAIRYLFRLTFNPSALQQLYNHVAEVQIRPLSIDPENRPCSENS